MVQRIPGGCVTGHLFSNYAHEIHGIYLLTSRPLSWDARTHPPATCGFASPAFCLSWDGCPSRARAGRRIAHSAPQDAPQDGDFFDALDVGWFGRIAGTAIAYKVCRGLLPRRRGSGSPGCLFAILLHAGPPWRLWAVGMGGYPSRARWLETRCRQWHGRPPPRLEVTRIRRWSNPKHRAIREWPHLMWHPWHGCSRGNRCGIHVARKWQLTFSKVKLKQAEEPLCPSTCENAWSGRRDSNPQQVAWKATALPIELQPHVQLSYCITNGACMSTSEFKRA